MRLAGERRLRHLSASHCQKVADLLCGGSRFCSEADTLHNLDPQLLLRIIPESLTRFRQPQIRRGLGETMLKFFQERLRTPNALRSPLHLAVV